jgi:aspartyl-tRNA(Asn)/glutamyl-tRNA(Gln) amidotransferase subunit A
VPTPRTIADAAAALRTGEVTSADLVETALANADRLDGELGVFIRRFPDQARAAAETADAELAAGRDRGPLHGIPLGIKDIIATVEAPATAQSLVMDPGWSAGEGDAPVVARLRAAGGIVVGKTSTFEYAIGFPDPEKPFPIPRNPWNPEHSPGGSSAGTGAGLPAGLFLGGLGTDTGGSIGIPASYCGITGLKGTYGRVPKSGCVPLGYSLDHIGPMTLSARDCALMLAAMAGPDATDPTTSAAPVGDYVAALTGDLTGLRIGLDPLLRTGDVADPGLPGVIAAARAVLTAAGAEVVDVELPLYEELVTAQLITMAAESTTYHLPDLQTRWLDYGRGARAYLATGAAYSATDYIQAQRVRRVGQKAIAAVFAEVDLVVTPTASTGAFAIADTRPTRIFEVMRGLHTQYWNAVGNPTLSLPWGFTATGLPLGMHIAGAPFDEATVLRAGDAFQQRTDWHLRRPVLTDSVAA